MKRISLIRSFVEQSLVNAFESVQWERTPSASRINFWIWPCLYIYHLRSFYFPLSIVSYIPQGSELDASHIHISKFVMEKSIYKQYGNNEPYTGPDKEFWRAKEPDRFFQLITGPSTNFYVGRDKTHYTIPKRLLYESSDFAKACLEGNFAEAGANGVWLPDVSPDVFQWIWKWLYQGRLGIEIYCYGWDDDKGNDRYSYSYSDDHHHSHSYSDDPEQIQQACQLLCRVHMLGERLLMDRNFFNTVQEEFKDFFKRVKKCTSVNPFTPGLIHEVLSHSMPVSELCSYSNTSLRSFLFEQLCYYDFCANFDFMKCSESFELDGAFAGKLMDYMSSQLVWAVELWGPQTESVVNVTDKKLKLAEEEGNSQVIVRGPKRRSDSWLALRYFCTFQGCTTTSFHKYSECFELDGAFAAEILAYMSGELQWVKEKWSEERGPRVNVAEEQENEAWNADDYNSIQRVIQRGTYR